MEAGQGSLLRVKSITVTESEKKCSQQIIRNLNREGAHGSRKGIPGPYK